MTAIVTFLCEGCGRRFPASQLYGTWPRKRDLARGRAHGPQPPYTMHVTVCSFACQRRAPHRTLADLYAAQGWPLSDERSHHA